MNADVGISFAAFILIGLGFVSALLARLAKRYPALSFALFFGYSAFSILISLIYIETHAVYVSDAAMMSEAIGASFRFILFHLFVVAGMLIVCTRFRQIRTIVAPPKWEAITAASILSVVMVLELGNLALSRSTAFPLIGQATRFDFWEKYAAFPILEKIFGVMVMYVPFVATALLIYSIEQGWHRIKLCAVGALVGLLIYSVGIGQVFHGNLLPATAIAGIYMSWRIIRKRPILTRRGILLALVGFVSIVFVSVEDLSHRGIASGGEDALDPAFYRVLVVQGAAVWRADDVRQDGTEGRFSDLLAGDDYLRRSVLPANLLRQYDAKGVNLQGSLPITSYLAIGFLPTILLCLVYGMVIGGTCALMLLLFTRGRILMMFVASYVWLWTLSSYNKASLEAIVNPSYLIAIIVLIIMAVLTGPSRAGQQVFRPAVNRQFAPYPLPGGPRRGVRPPASTDRLRARTLRSSEH